MTITLAIPTYRRFDLCAQCVASALAGDTPPDRVLIIDNSAGHCPPIAGATIRRGRQPQSVAKAWNDAIRDVAGDWIILANDDITFAPDTIQRLVEVAEATPQAAIVSAIEGQRFSLYLLRWAAYQAIGAFDEGFQAAYFEDNDYARRAVLAGWELALALTPVSHVGSATIATYRGPAIARQNAIFDANARRYLGKWGGPPHAETFVQAWNGGAPQ